MTATAGEEGDVLGSVDVGLVTVLRQDASQNEVIWPFLIALAAGLLTALAAQRCLLVYERTSPRWYRIVCSLLGIGIAFCFAGSALKFGAKGHFIVGGVMMWLLSTTIYLLILELTRIAVKADIRDRSSSQGCGTDEGIMGSTAGAEARWRHWTTFFSRARSRVDEAPLKVSVHSAGEGTTCFVVHHRDPDVAFAADLRILLQLSEKWRFYIGSAAPEPADYRVGPGQATSDSVQAFVSALWGSYPREDNADNAFSAASTGTTAAGGYLEVAEALSAGVGPQGVLFDRSIVDLLQSWYCCSSTRADEVAAAIEAGLGQCTFVEEDRRWKGWGSVDEQIESLRAAEGR